MRKAAEAAFPFSSRQVMSCQIKTSPVKSCRVTRHLNIYHKNTEVTLGLGDEIMATSFAKGAKARGKRIAFGDGKQYVESPWQRIIFQGNPNICLPNQIHEPNVEWVPFYKGHRIYNRPGPNRRWIWNYEFKAQPGEFFFGSDELEFATVFRKGFVLVEPNVPMHKSSAVNKNWGMDRYQAVADLLLRDGHHVVQFAHHGYPALKGVIVRECPSIRHAAAAMRRAAVIVCPEGGTHHACAAIGKRAVVVVGGFIPAQIIGYDFHVNLTGGAESCGSLMPCAHCARALKAISVEEVYAAAVG